ncbi:MAG: 5-deoxy-glucuronate isomerase [Bacteroidetes bacterium GWF2_42_66]|nr:MAG: 5-deoxy-glucuronate isomerase [Bacteroidetes bacterium GWA2_42_15]OFY01414.1 MAG: 5-deoxy-glucuronate isomerase [Bacteroidetes bacterium GWE2_42_39]OFY42255.1 MAG: 5-deoxy-glucuronate isomerase [Bacteroidetes bacterium GWF2_42_66]
MAGFGIYQSILKEETGWQFLNFQARLMKQGEKWIANTGGNEYAIILLGGNYSVKTDKGNWETGNGRKDVFSGIAHSLYLPRNTQFELTAESEVLDIAYGWCETDEDHPACFKRPEEAAIEIRGGDNATRQINSLVQPGFDCHRLVSVEVYTPSGNWSSFPAHKHDARKVDASGKVLEACLEEIYFYKIDKPQGFAIQQIYNDNRSLDEIAVARDNDVVLVPEGYHPVVAGHGYNVYYLNFLTGSDQSLANTDDPDHKWIYNSWKGRDPRIPIVTAEMNNEI